MLVRIGAVHLLFESLKSVKLQVREVSPRLYDNMKYKYLRIHLSVLNFSQLLSVLITTRNLSNMPSQNSALHFLYRQFFLHPTALPRSLSLSGQIAIVTGSNTGLGLSIAQQYLECGLSHLIVAVRSVEKGEAATTKLLLPFEHSEVKPIVEVCESNNP